MSDLVPQTKEKIIEKFTICFWNYTSNKANYLFKQETLL